MVFCGKCGFQLTSGNITCPRCGTPTETEYISQESQPDNPTIAASTIFPANPSSVSSQETISPGRPVEQQPLILGSQPNDYNLAEQMANEATNMMGTQYAGSDQIPTRAVYPEYQPQSAAYYPQQPAGPYPSGYNMATPSYDQQFGTSSEEAEKARARGRITGLLLILIGLLLILGAMVLFIMTRTTSTSAPASLHLAQHAVFSLLYPPTRN
jgi:uncharacterized Zn finger protein (UPF0148 family)